MDDMSGRPTPLGSALTQSERWQTVALGPIVIAVFTMVPLGFAGPIAQWQGTDFLAVMTQIIDVLQVTTGKYYDILGVVATVLVALAAATNLGVAERLLGERARVVVLVCVLACAILTASLAASMIAVAVVEPRRAFDAVVAVVAGWICLLVAQTVTGTATARERARSARAQWKPRKRIAADLGISRHDDVAKPVVVMSEALLWLVPLGLWVLIGSVLIAVSFGPEVAGRLVPLVASLFLGSALVTVGWRASADLSESPKMRRQTLRGMTALGALASVVLAVTLLSILPALGVSLLAFTALHAVALLVLSARFPPTARIEHAATIRALRRAHASKVRRQVLVREGML